MKEWKALCNVCEAEAVMWSEGKQKIGIACPLCSGMFQVGLLQAGPAESREAMRLRMANFKRSTVPDTLRELIGNQPKRGK